MGQSRRAQPGARDVLIRPADLDDEDDVQELQDLCRATFRRARYHPVHGQYAYTAQLGEELVGFLVWQPHWRDELLTEAYINLVGVTPPARGLGLQRRLMTRAQRAATRFGFRSVSCIVKTINAPSMRNVAALGYRPFRPDQPWWSNDGDITYWRRDLDSSRAR